MISKSQQPIAVLSTNTDGLILTWNHGMELATGIKAANALECNLFQLASTFENTNIKVRLENVLNYGTTEYLSSRFHPTLSKFFKNIDRCHITVSPLRQSNESIIGMLMVAEGNEATISSQSHKNSVNEDKVKSVDLSSLIHELINNHRNPAILSSIIAAFKENDDDFLTIAQELITSHDHEVRMYTAQILGTSSNPRSLKMLIQLLKDENTNVKYHAIEALGKVGRVKAIPKLEAIALSGDFFLASAAIDALINIDAGLNSYNKLRKLFKHPDYTFEGIEMAGQILHIKPFSDLCKWLSVNDFAQKATENLAKWIAAYGIEQFFGTAYHECLNKQIDQDGINNLANLLDRSNDKLLKKIIVPMVFIDKPSIRSKLINLLGNPNLQNDIVEIVIASGCNFLSSLKEIIKTTTDKETQKAIAVILGRIGDDSVVPELCDLLGVDDELTLISAGALAKIGSRSAYPYLLQHLGTPSPVVRRAIISALNSISHPDMPADLKKFIYSPNPYIQESAVRIAGYFGYPQYVNAVIDATSSPAINVSIAAIEVLPFFDGIDNIKEIYLKAIGQNDVRLKIAAAKAIAFLLPDVARELIKKLIDDDDPWVRNYTIRSISTLGIFDFEKQLKAIAQSTKEVVFVRLAAIQAIGELNLAEPHFFLQFISEPNFDIAQTATHALGFTGSAMAEQLLATILNENYVESIKMEAASALANFNTDVAAQTLYEHSKGINRNLAIKCTRTLGLLNTQKAYELLLKLCLDPRVCKTARDALIQKRQHYIEELFQFVENGFEHKMLIINLLHQIRLPGKEEILFKLKNDKNSRIRQGAKTLLDSLTINY